MNLARPVTALIALPLLVGIAGLFGPLACSPNAGGTSLGNRQSVNGSGGDGAGASAGTGAGAGNGTGTEILGGGAAGNGNAGAGAGNGSGGDQSCGESFGAEKILVDATVTDTIVSYSPVALYIMLDRSGSMVTGFPTGSAQSWGNATAALSGFLSGPSLQGIDVGLGFFPPLTGTGACDGSDCYIPAVDIGPVSQTASQINAAMNNNKPIATNFTPTECALNGMIKQCEDYSKSASEPCVAVLITDGVPDQCDTNATNLANIISAGLAKGVKTFVLQLPGVTADFLNPLAAAGGTGAAIDVTGGSSTIINALDSIRGKVAVSSSHHVTKSVSKPLVCQWNIPPTPPGEIFDPTQVNVQFTPSGGALQTFGHVDSVDKCAGVSADAWYYSPPPPAAPTQVLVCPKTCDKLKANSDGQVDVQFGCATNNIIQ